MIASEDRGASRESRALLMKLQLIASHRLKRVDTWWKLGRYREGDGRRSVGAGQSGEASKTRQAEQWIGQEDPADGMQFGFDELKVIGVVLVRVVKCEEVEIDEIGGQSGALLGF